MNLWLPAASADAPQIDRLLLSLLLISLAVLALVAFLLVRYIVKYRAGSRIDRGEEGRKSWILETSWTVATLVVFLGLFVWGVDLYLKLFRPPLDALKIYIVAKQWMWKAEHVGGQREINAVHLPVGRPVELIMTSEDVIHDFSVPAFRVKHDVLPGRYESIWFTATRAGVYSLYCTQFCGLDHSKLVGEIFALEPPLFAAWLANNGGGDSLARQGAELYMRYGCSGCHGGNGAGGAQGAATVRAPSLEGLYGAPVALTDGTVVAADDRYIHDAIVLPERQVVAGYPAIMPSFAGQIDEEGILKLVAYIRSLASRGQP